MKKPLVKNFSEEVLFTLESQKQDEKFTKYVRAILTGRYLDDKVTISSLAKRFKRANITSFQKDLLWDTISLKFATSPIVELKESYNIIDNMPIDYLVRVTQNCLHPSLKEYARVVCYEKQLKMEEELGLDPVDYEKYEEDEVIINSHQATMEVKKLRK